MKVLLNIGCIFEGEGDLTDKDFDNRSKRCVLKGYPLLLGGFKNKERLARHLFCMNEKNQSILRKKE